MLRVFCLAIALMFSLDAAGQSYRRPPQDGYWWNPSEAGRGFTMETQGEVIAVTHYVYDAQGRSTFLQTAGTWDSANGRLVTSLFGFSGGQCLGCTHASPTATSMGEATLQFTSTTTGEIIYPSGVRVPVQRYDFGYQVAEEKLLGTWNSTWYSSLGNAFPNFIYFSERCTSCTTPNTVQGVLERARSGRPALATSNSGAYIILIDAATSFWDLYYVVADSDSWFGLACTYSKGSTAPSISSCLGLVEAARAHSLAHARSIFGMSKRIGDDADEGDAIRLEASADHGEVAEAKAVVAALPFDVQLSAVAASLEADLQRLSERERTSAPR